MKCFFNNKLVLVGAVTGALALGGCAGDQQTEDPIGAYDQQANAYAEGGQQEELAQQQQADDGYGETNGYNYNGDGTDAVADFEAQQTLQQQQNVLSNTYQQDPEYAGGEGINNAVGGDEYGYAQQPGQIGGVDEGYGYQQGQALPAAQTALPAQQAVAPSYDAGTIPAGWARTQNGLFINLSGLSDEPLGYEEANPEWR